MGPTQHVQTRNQTRTFGRGKIWPRIACLGSTRAPSPAGSRSWARTADGFGTAARARSQQDVWVCGRGHFVEGSFLFYLALVSRGHERQQLVEDSQGDRDPRGSSRSRTVASTAQRLQGGTTFGH